MVGKETPVPLPATSREESGEVAEILAKKGGIGTSTMKDALLVDAHGTDEKKQEVVQGKKSVKTAAKEIREEKKKEENVHKFNATNDNIEWAKWTWNPVTGCKHGCKYCYARDIAERFYPQKFTPTFHKDRLSAPFNTKIPKSRKNEEGIKNVFVCSMADLFGDWVPMEWINDIMDVVRKTPQWNYIFLTKNPKRLLEVKNWPANTWVGTTIDSKKMVKGAVDTFREFARIRRDEDEGPSVTFISFEPLTERIKFPKEANFSTGEPESLLKFFDWVIFGGQSPSTGDIARQPEWEWVEILFEEARKSDCAIYWKPNLTIRPKEYPSGMDTHGEVFNLNCSPEPR